MDTNGVNTGQKPYSFCPSSCSAASVVCEKCKAYKDALADTLMDVENPEAYYANFVLDPEAPAGGVKECSVCGAPAAAGDRECAYCGAGLESVKIPIRIRSRSEIPSPVDMALSIIFDRQKLVAPYQKQQQTNTGSLLMGLLALAGGISNTGTKNVFDVPMTAQDAQEMAQKYGVPIGVYLAGLDTDTYLTKEGKRREEKAEAQRQARMRTLEVTQNYFEEKQRIDQKHREAMRELEEKRRQIRQEQHERELQIALSKVPKYMG